MGKIGYQLRDVLLKFSKVNCNVLLIEMSKVVIYLRDRHGGLEACIGEMGNEILGHRLHFEEGLPAAFNLLLAVFDGLSNVVSLLTHVGDLLFNFLLAHGSNLFIPCDLGVQLVVFIFHSVSCLAELIDVVEEGVILLFGLDEGRDNLIDVGDASVLLDDLEGLLDDFSVSQVLVEQPFLLLILVRDRFKSDIKNFDGVEEFLRLRVLLGVFVADEFDVLVFILQTFLKPLESEFELLSVHLLFGLHGENSILVLICLLRLGSRSLSLCLLGTESGFHRCLRQVLDLLGHLLHDGLGELDLVPHDDDLVVKILVLTDGHLEKPLFNLNLMVSRRPFHLLLMHVFRVSD